jgi:orotidine-5'-phosphate decarboxylase
MDARQRLILALDLPTAEQALALADRTARSVGLLKVGKQLFVAEGPDLVRQLSQRAGIFLDLKFHDIPNTVASAVAAATRLGVKMITVHTAGGRAALEAARDAARETASGLGVEPPVLLGVTVLTSLDDAAAAEAGLNSPVADLVLRRAVLAREAGINGLVCSAREVARVRAAVGTSMTLVTPGIRPAGAASGDQARVATPGAAIRDGADYLVIGRPISGAEDPALAARTIVEEIAAAQG